MYGQSPSYLPEESGVMLEQGTAKHYDGQNPSSQTTQSGKLIEQIPGNIYQGQYQNSHGQTSPVNRPWGNLPGQLSSTNFQDQYSAKGFGRQKRGTSIPINTSLFSI